MTNEERNQQVGNMVAIYEAASKVVVWLGRYVANTLQALLRGLANHILGSGHPWTATFSQICDMDMSHYNSILIEATRSISNTLIDTLGRFQLTCVMVQCESLACMEAQIVHIFSGVS